VRIRELFVVAAVVVGVHCAPAPIVWNLDDLTRIGDRPATVRGEPRPVDAPDGTALEFDGIDDALFVDVHPLAGATEFTVEVVFRPDAGGAAEQRFLHLQESASKDRILVETRLTDDGRWFLDTYVKSRGEAHTLFARAHKHPVGRWYHAALVVGGGRMRHYVDGVEEMSRPIDFFPQGAGRSSIGVRINEVYWFKGAISRARFTPRALAVNEFWTIDGRRG
jgi:hypothetical protein